MTWFTPKWIPSGTPSERRRRRVVEMDDRFSPGRWRLYAITDERIARGRSHPRVAEAALRGGADVLQLRDKEAGGGKLYRVALQLRKLTREAKIPLIVNDRLDIALPVEAGGTKGDAGDPVGLAPGGRIRRCWPLHIVAIGGINGGTAGEVREAGAD